jgi:hypothetical protein
MLEELQRRNYSQATIRGYILAVKQFAEYFHKSPDLLGAEEVRQFQLYLLNDKSSRQARSNPHVGSAFFLLEDFKAP